MATSGGRPDSDIVFSFIMCSRTDEYQGNSVWRTETALNYLGATVEKLGRQDQVECVVVDWGSDEPLRDALRLTPEAARIVTFVYVPPDIAKLEQRDSPFPEVIALNAAARRTSGQYIGRIDQDTLVGPSFLDKLFWLHEERRMVSPLDRSMLLSNRKRVPVRFARRSPELWEVAAFVKWFRPVLKLMEPLPLHLFNQSYVGLWMVHRDVWFDVGGYDEDFIYMDWMEVDFMLRLAPDYTLVNLGELTDHDIYHLDHGPVRVPWGSKRKRKANPIRDTVNLPPERCPNGPDWGLANYQLASEPGIATLDARDTGRSFARMLRLFVTSLGFFALSLMDDVVSVILRFVDQSPLRRVRVAIRIVSGEPIGQWPTLLRDKWRLHKENGSTPTSEESTGNKE